MTFDLLLSPAGLGLLGLLVGSFLNVVVHRLPRMLDRQWGGDAAHQMADDDSHQRVFGDPLPAGQQDVAQALVARLDALPALGLARPSSRCPSCGHPIRWFENIPVISWLVLRGRCSACRAAIGLRYPFVEVLCAALFAAVGWHLGATPQALLGCAFVATLLALSLIDWDTTVLPDGLTLPLLWAGLAAAALGWTSQTPAQAIVGAAAGYLSLWSVYWFFKLATGKEGMGYGDFKLLAAIGAWLGWQAILPVVLISSIIGAAVGIGMKVMSQLREGRYVPFGPFLAGGGVAVMLLGPERVMAWLGWH